MAFSQWRESFAQVAQRSRKWSGKVSWAVLETGGARAVQDQEPIYRCSLNVCHGEESPGSRHLPAFELMKLTTNPVINTRPLLVNGSPQQSDMFGLKLK